MTSRNKANGRTNSLSRVFLPLFLLVLVALMLVSRYGPSYKVRRSEAYQAYVNSREPHLRDDTVSWGFETRGMEFGDTQARVDALMQGAKSTRIITREQMWAGREPEVFSYVKFYEFVYEPQLFIKEWKKHLPIVSESFYVYFDHEEKATYLFRAAFVRHDPQSTKAELYNLKDRTTSRVAPREEHATPIQSE